RRSSEAMTESGGEATPDSRREEETTSDLRSAATRQPRATGPGPRADQDRPPRGGRGGRNGRDGRGRR
ncbi:MAG: hypothetical protein VX672_05335, partial [Planctomycetota bacterium]|nr:hypothetical protein [Planctomycetota bacterium]